MFKKGLSLAFAISFVLSGIFTLVFINVTYVMASEKNPFTMMDRARDEGIKVAKGKSDEHSALKSNLSADEKKKIEKAMLSSPGKQYIVKFTENASKQQIFDIVNSYKYKMIGNSDQRLFMIKLIDVQDFEQRAAGIIEFIEEDKKKKLQAIPSDTYYTNQWALSAMNMPGAWDIEKGSNSVYVAVIDSGVYRDQPDLLGADIRCGWDYIFDEFCNGDSMGHGTGVTGIIGAQTNNAEGIAGINWNVAIIPLLVAYSDGTIYASGEIQAIYDAADMGCDVINLSLYGTHYSTAENSAVSYALSKGSIVVAAAGNDGTSAYGYPASYDGVISVGSLDSNLSRSYYSQYNNKVDVTAPGSNILTTGYPLYVGYDYVYWSGTSFSAPQVSGVAALASACDSSLTAAKFQNLIKITSTDLGSSGYDNYYGYGLINAEKMLKYCSTVVSISATDATASEQGLDIGKFTVTRTGSTASSLTVKYSMSGTASNGTDYNSLSGSVTIPAGSSTATIIVTPKDDSTIENSEPVIATLAVGSAYNIGTPNRATITIADNDKSTVTIKASDAIATEAGPTTGKFTVTRSSGITATALTVKYTLSGTATNGTDYNILSGSVIIPTGATTATITMTPKDDTAAESNETVIATISANSSYTVGTAKSATVTIYDNDKTQVTIKATDAAAYEAGLDTAKYTVTRVYGSTASALTVNYTVSGTATNGTDYNTLSGKITIAAGATTAIITLTPKNDTTVESNETAIITLASGTGYNVGPAKSATATIYDNDKYLVTIKASDASATEAGPTTGKFTVTRAYGSTATALTVKYTLSGTAINGTDYNSLSGTVIIPAGATTATITVMPKNDTIKESNETVIATIAASSAYNIGPAKSATVTIADND